MLVLLVLFIDIFGNSAVPVLYRLRRTQSALLGPYEYMLRDQKSGALVSKYIS